jgi:hypothetical protein
MSPPQSRIKEGLLPASLAQFDLRSARASAGTPIRLGVDPHARTRAGPLAAGRTSLLWGQRTYVSVGVV